MSAEPFDMAERLSSSDFAKEENERISRINQKRLAKINHIRLKHMDGLLASVPGPPPIEAIEKDTVVFRCPKCDRQTRSNLDQAGSDHSCECGNLVTVPIPLLSHMAKVRLAERQAAMGIGKCRICGANIKIEKNNMTRVGFCALLCAKKGMERFQEVIPREGAVKGGKMVFTCECGEAMQAVISKTPETKECSSCKKKVWVPAAPAGGGEADAPVVDCSKCGRKPWTAIRWHFRFWPWQVLAWAMPKTGCMSLQ